MALIGTEAAGEGWPPKAQDGGPGVKRYEVEVNGVQTTLLLSDADAKARGLTPSVKEAVAPANKSRSAQKRAEVKTKAWGGAKDST